MTCNFYKVLFGISNRAYYAINLLIYLQKNVLALLKEYFTSLKIK